MIRRIYANDTRDKVIATVVVLVMFALAADLWSRGAVSLYGRFFMWSLEMLA